MVIAIDWTSTHPTLHQFHHDHTHRGRRWPDPAVDSPLVSQDELQRGRRQWSKRLVATYASTGRAATLLHHLMALGAPLELIAGAAYTTDELSRHLAITTHFLQRLQPPESLTLPEALITATTDRPSWQVVVYELLDLFVFNLSISIAVYEATAAATSDRAIAEMSAVQIDSLAELVGFGRAALDWIYHNVATDEFAPTERLLPALLAAHEEVCHGSAEVLDVLAGEVITVETRAGNLGTLEPEHLAAIFYHVLDASIFPALQELDWDGLEAWRRHENARPITLQRPAIVAAINIAPP